jgi:L-cysteine:1D-myo-inositol 2-amino-2-deoxy-alpha-D-glucopyranoside ligase
MKSWNYPPLPSTTGAVVVPVLFDTSTGTRVEASSVNGDNSLDASLYVCGITPYDATHVGHAATYIAFDTLVRSWLYAGFTITYVQNVTDVDDPLLERAAARGIDWRELASSQVDLFRTDMEALRVVPPQHFVAVTDVINDIGTAVKAVVDGGLGYRIDDDIYFDVNSASNTDASGDSWELGDVGGLDRSIMATLSAQRGGDPERAGKRDVLDPLLWRGARPGEPAWPSPVGEGRPGWHIECAVIASLFTTLPLTVQGGGSDLVFPHHEFTAAHSAAMHGERHATVYAHSGMVAFDGEKMSKSLGNLVLVSELLSSGTDPRAIRLAILAHHYRSDWEWTPLLLSDATHRLNLWLSWAARTLHSAEQNITEDADGSRFSAELQSMLSADLDTPSALAHVDSLVTAGAPASRATLDAIDALLGIALR